MSGTSTFLYKAYKKKADSLASGLENPSSRFETSQIHRIRLDIKRIRAIFQLIEILRPEEFSEQREGLFLRNLFKTAGTIRELQVNLLNLEQLTEKPDIILPFKEFLIREEINYRKRFKYAATRFDISHLSEISLKIRQLESDLPAEQIIDQAIAFITATSANIKKLNTGPGSTESMHKIRQQLKSLGGIAVLIAAKKPDDKLKNLINAVKNTDFRLGQWHDHVILKVSLDSFLELTEEGTDEIALQLHLLSEK